MDDSKAPSFNYNKEECDTETKDENGGHPAVCVLTYCAALFSV